MVLLQVVLSGATTTALLPVVVLLLQHTPRPPDHLIYHATSTSRETGKSKENKMVPLTFPFHAATCSATFSAQLQIFVECSYPFGRSGVEVNHFIWEDFFVV